MDYVVTTRGSRLNVRSGPGMQHGIVRSLANAERVSVSMRNGEWGNIALNQWVNVSFLSPASGAAGAPTGAGAVPGASAAGAPLNLVRRESTWLVFNRDAFRPEVVQYFWGSALTPTLTELYPRTAARPDDLDLGDTHWALAQNAFAARGDLLTRMRREARRQMDGLPGSTPPIPRPDWVSVDAWNRFQTASEGLHRYARASRLQTDAILIKRDGMLWGAYAEASTDEAFLRRQMGVIEPSFWRRVALGDTTENSRVRWLATANRGYNDFMRRAVTASVGPGEALRNYNEAVHQAYIRAFLPLLGIGSAHSAGEPLMGIARSLR